MKLYSYWRSSTSYRVRIALNLKGVPYETQGVDLTASEQTKPAFQSLNPSAGVPALVLDDGTILTQSMAILRWLDATYPEPYLLPQNPTKAAAIEAASLVVACDIHPVNNLKVIGKLKTMGHSPEDAVTWMRDWMSEGLTAFQTLIDADSTYCFGEDVSLADVCLIPQLYNAHRWGVDLTTFSRLTDIETRCLALAAFDKARPENQPDATS